MEEWPSEENEFLGGPGSSDQVWRARAGCERLRESLSSLMHMDGKNVSINYGKIREGVGVIYKG